MRTGKSTRMGNIEDTPLGTIWIATSEAGMVAVSLWQERSRFEEDVKQLTGAKPRFDFESVASIGEQIDAYLHGELQRFDVRINWSVLTPFQEMALREVHEIPYGRLATYGDIARRIGKPRGVRAVGRANATNPMPIVIPCHRVIGTDGRLHGYGAPGGLETKAWLLRLEGSWLL